MTTGCLCRNPGCGGISYWPDGLCEDCTIEASPSALTRTVLRILNGPRTTPAGAQADREAGA